MDLLIQENGDGGEFVLRGNDLVMTKGIENIPYLSQFGGEDDWWANDYMDPTTPQYKWSSETENVLRVTPLNSNGRIKIEQAMLNDLKELNKQTGCEISVQVMIVNPNRLEALITIDKLEARYVWIPDASFLTYKI